mmetsp:Transcript_163015/g.396076  ORF Transcript_163015/g.396076 Transcript_163015/m.396076 type:complete len:242 (-) Transcript_163015:129-854(-)
MFLACLRGRGVRRPRGRHHLRVGAGLRPGQQERPGGRAGVRAGRRGHHRVLHHGRKQHREDDLSVPHHREHLRGVRRKHHQRDLGHRGARELRVWHEPVRQAPSRCLRRARDAPPAARRLPAPTPAEPRRWACTPSEDCSRAGLRARGLRRLRRLLRRLPPRPGRAHPAAVAAVAGAAAAAAPRGAVPGLRARRRGRRRQRRRLRGAAGGRVLRARAVTLRSGGHPPIRRQAAVKSSMPQR